MLCRVFEKSELSSLFGLLANRKTVFGPVSKGLDTRGKRLYAYTRGPSFSDCPRLTTTSMSAKALLSPPP